VEQVEFIDLRDFGHARGEGKVVRRILEERVSRNLDLMEMDIGMGLCQADRLGIRDEVNLVITIGEFDAKFGSDHTAAAVGRVTGDSNPHEVSVETLTAYWI
jgi:hypothetical protein